MRPSSPNRRTCFASVRRRVLRRLRPCASPAPFPSAVPPLPVVPVCISFPAPRRLSGKNKYTTTTFKNWCMLSHSLQLSASCCMVEGKLFSMPRRFPIESKGRRKKLREVRAGSLSGGRTVVFVNKKIFHGRDDSVLERHWCLYQSSCSSQTTTAF
ncbi:hypothetical protein AKJ16_DCAP00700 [Drosera capensis]